MSKAPTSTNVNSSKKVNTPLTRRKPTRSRYDLMTILRLCKGEAHDWKYRFDKNMKRGRGTIEIYFKNAQHPVVIPILRTRLSTFCVWLWENRMELPYRLYKTSELVEMFAGDYKLSYEARMGRELRRVGFICVPDNVHRAKKDNVFQSKIWWLPETKNERIPENLRTVGDVLREHDLERCLERFATRKTRALRALSHEEKKLMQKLRLVQLKKAALNKIVAKKSAR